MLTRTTIPMMFTLLLGAAACDADAVPPVAHADATAAVAVTKDASPVARGKYLVDTSGCHDCHTPLVMGPGGPVPDMTRMLSGHPAELVMPPAPELPLGPWLVTVAATNTAWAGPWGVSFTANLTPDEHTGLGAWTTQNFIDTIRNARHMGTGRPLLPPMPAPVYAQLTDDDLAAIFAYLQTIPAQRNRVPDPIAPKAATAGATVTSVHSRP